MKLWVLRSAVRSAVKKIKFPSIRIMSSSWSCEDHAHFCYAYRVLETEDFLSVCPLSKCKKKFEVEHEDECDMCEYLGGVDFLIENGKKKIQFW